MSIFTLKNLPATVVGISLGFFNGSAIALQIFPNQGVNFSQLDLTFLDARQENSPYGLVTADFAVVSSITGLSSGYLNISTESGNWIVQNMPIDLSSQYPGLGTVFNLDSLSDIIELNLYVDVSENPTANFTPPINANFSTFSVGAKDYNAEGSLVGNDEDLAPIIPLNPVINFQVGGLISVSWQPGHPNIEQAINQCGPAAVANSLQWLEDTYGITIKQEHKPGVRDNTLVGELDKDMLRPAGKPVASAKDFLRGKLDYINTEKLSNVLDIKHKSRTGINWLPNNETVGSATSKVNKDPKVSLIDWIIKEINDGENVEVRLGEVGGKGGHYIDLIGGGYVLGVPWLAWAHDTRQGSNGGTSVADYGYAWSLIADNTISIPLPKNNTIFAKSTIDYAVAESPKIPEPAPTLSLLSLGTIGAASTLKRKLKPSKSTEKATTKVG